MHRNLSQPARKHAAIKTSIPGFQLQSFINLIGFSESGNFHKDASLKWQVKNYCTFTFKQVVVL